MKRSIAYIFIVLLLIPQTTSAQCHIDDWTGLKAFYENTNGDSWVNRTGWDIHIDNHNSPPSDCNLQDLFGVIIQGGSDRKDIRVTTLQFAGNGLIGIIPPEIGKLTYLENFNLQVLLADRDDNLTGNIPIELGSLKNLQVLNLANNQLKGKIPAELGNLTNLLWLNLSFNKLTGSIPPELSNINRLAELILTENRLSGAIPPELGNFNGLVSLRLGSNQLTGNIPKELANQTNLFELILSRNQLTGTIPPEFGNFARLEFLGLNDNQLTGTIPPELGNQTSIRGMFLANNQLFGCYPNSFTLYCDRPANSTNEHISDGNQFDAEWEVFCNNNEGACPPNSINSYYLKNEIDFVYNLSSKTLNLTSSNLPIENITLYNSNGQLFKNYAVNNLSNIEINTADLIVGLYVVVAAIGKELFHNKLVIMN